MMKCNLDDACDVAHLWYAEPIRAVAPAAAPREWFPSFLVVCAPVPGHADSCMHFRKEAHASMCQRHEWWQCAGKVHDVRNTNAVPDPSCLTNRAITKYVMRMHFRKEAHASMCQRHEWWQRAGKVHDVRNANAVPDRSCLTNRAITKYVVRSAARARARTTAAASSECAWSHHDEAARGATPPIRCKPP